MKLITTGKELHRELDRLIQQYPNYAVAVAWASFDTPAFKTLLERRERIRRAVVGIHFYQTDPRVLEAFVGSNEVRFMLQPSGVFHPKIYYFWDGKGWELLIGSANFTVGAIKDNSEALALLSNLDDETGTMGKAVLALIESYWSVAKVMDGQTAGAYRRSWNHRQPVLRKLGGVYGPSKPKKPPVASSVLTMSWSDFKSAVEREGMDRVNQRCDLLDKVRSEFTKHSEFQTMELGPRQMIAGLPNDYEPESLWFGSMRPAGDFKGAVYKNSPHISHALNHIPLEGPVSESNFNAYVKEFAKAFPNQAQHVASASRLLAMKRPDQFVCVDAKNRANLCADFGIPQKMTYDRYWSEIVDRVMDAPWWNSDKPAQDDAARLWTGRAAMLDAIFMVRGP